jgi:hypothetical protein
VTGDHNTGDHGIAQFAATACPLTLCHKTGSNSRCLRIKVDDTALNIILDQMLEFGLKRCTAAAPGQEFDAVADFKDGDGRGPYRKFGLAIQPLPHQRIGPLLHQLGEHVGIEDHHQSKVTGLIL